MALHSRLILSGCVATLLFVAGTASTSSAQQAPASTATSGLAALAAIQCLWGDFREESGHV